MDPQVLIKLLEAILESPQVDEVVKDIIDAALAQIKVHASHKK